MTIARNDLIDVAEILFRARGALEACGRKGGQAKDALSPIADLAAGILRSADEDPGRTAEDADGLKVDLLKRAADAPPFRPLEESLELAADATGCAGLIHRVVGRFSEFVQRAAFAARGEFKGLVEDDAWLPVGPWVQQQGVDMGDLRQAGAAFLAWTKAADKEFSRRRSAAQPKPPEPKPPEAKPFRLGDRSPKAGSSS